MTDDQLIDGYVAEVVALLPRKQRRDVAQELRTLLTEEVDAVADVAGRSGSPVPLIDPADTRRFLILATANLRRRTLDA